MKKFLLVLFVSFFFLFPRAANAEVIHSFDTSIQAHKDGSMDVKESIDYDFEDIEHHGIFRDIPLYAKVGDLYRIYKISDVSVTRDGKKEKFSTTQDREKISFKIGNPDKTMTGDHKYEINYKVENGIGSNFADHDEIYWSITGNGWDAEIEKASGSVTTDTGLTPTKVICYQGSYGSKDTSCSVDKNSTTSTGILGPNQGLSMIMVYPPGTFPKSILSRTPPQTFGDKVWGFILANILIILFVINVVIPLGLISWYERHKNKKRFGAPSVTFDLPEDENGDRIPPAVAGTIDTAALDRDDVTATIFDLAIRKYIKLSEEKTQKTLRPDETNQIITKVKELEDDAPTFEHELFDRLFRDADTIKVSDLKKDFYVTFQSMETSVFSYLVKSGYYVKNPKVQRALLFALAIVVISFGQVILAATIFFLSRKLNGRTQKGDEIDFKIDGLKLFLKSMDRSYKWQAKNFYTVEQMIPYAMALGYIDEFMAALKVLKPDYNPTWYSGYHGNFYTNYGAFTAASSSNFTTSAPSSSSGSGGGGFSGGGGGGGGGGSW